MLSVSAFESACLLNRFTVAELGFALAAQGRESEAVDAWQIASDMAGEFFLRGEVARGAMRYAEALRWYEEALKLESWVACGTMRDWCTKDRLSGKRHCGLMSKRLTQKGSTYQVYNGVSMAEQVNKDDSLRIGETTGIV